MAKRKKGSGACPPGQRYKVRKGGRTISTHKKKKAATASRKRAGKGASVSKC